MVSFASIPETVSDDEPIPFVLGEHWAGAASLDHGGFRVRRGGGGLRTEVEYGGAILRASLLEVPGGWVAVASVGEVVNELWQLQSRTPDPAFPVISAGRTGQPLQRAFNGESVPVRVVPPDPAVGAHDTTAAFGMRGDLADDWPLGLLLTIPVTFVALELLLEHDRLYAGVRAAFAPLGRREREDARLKGAAKVVDTAKQVLETLEDLGIVG